MYKSKEDGNDVTCHAVPVVLFLFLRDKIHVIVKKKNRPQFSMAYTLIDLGNDAIKCLKLWRETTPLPLHLSFEHFMTSFLWSLRV